MGGSGQNGDRGDENSEISQKFFALARAAWKVKKQKKEDIEKEAYFATAEDVQWERVGKTISLRR